MAIAMNNHVFKGHRTLLGNKYVTYGELELPTRFDIYPTSKNGFDWGNSSLGANQLAFSILFQLSSKELAEKYAEQFMVDVVRKLHARDWILSASNVLEWIQKHCEIPKQQNIKKVKPKAKAANNTIKKTKSKKSNVVKEICQELDITQKQLAEILEVPEGTVSSWAVKNEIPRLGKKAIEFYILSQKNQKIVDSYRSFMELLKAS
jgi:DNA-binding transcriptional regulator YiaG